MKRINLLNRGVHSLYLCMKLVMQLCGLNCYAYCSKRNVFIRKRFLEIYSIALSFINGIFVFGIIIFIHPREPNTIFITVKMLVSLLTRIHFYVYEESLIALLKELFLIVQDMRVLARHPNFFRLSHVMLFLLALQSLVRSVMVQLDISLNMHQNKSIGLNLAVFWICICLLYLLIFHLIVTSILLIFIGLIACYDELHRCTRRISNDVYTLRMAQWRMEGGQRLLLVEQLRTAMEQLIEVRARMFSVTVRLVKFFRFHLVVSILYWIGHVVMIFVQINETVSISTFWSVAVCLSNIAFYCTIFEIFVWKSKLSRSFWHLHLMNSNKDFDRTVDKLLHRELVECVSVVAYGIPLNMKLFCKIFMLTIAYTLMRFAYHKF